MPLRSGTILGLIATAGGGKKEGIQVVEQTFKILAGFAGLKLRTLLVPNAPRDPKDLVRNATLRTKAEAFGGALIA
jgi:hypothetical protein